MFRLILVIEVGRTSSLKVVTRLVEIGTSRGGGEQLWHLIVLRRAMGKAGLLKGLIGVTKLFDPP